MTLLLREVSLSKFMELNGTLQLPQGKAVVLWGPNQQGKTNLVNAIRYVFLKEAKGRGRRGKYDEWKLPSKKELVFDGDAAVEVVFEHNKRLYVLKRTVTKGGRETCVLHPLERPSEEIGMQDFLKSKLKVSILDSLFAPEIVGGFRLLFNGDLDQSVGEMFRDITAIRALAKRFALRIQRMQQGAEVEAARIENEYNMFCESLLKASAQLEQLSEFKAVRKFEAGRTGQKLDKLGEKLQNVIGKLQEERLVSDLESARNDAKSLEELKREIRKESDIRQTFAALRRLRADHRKIKRWLHVANRVAKITEKVPSPPHLDDKQMHDSVTRSFRELTQAKSLHRETLRLSNRNRIRPELASERIRELSAVIRVLRKKTKVGKEIDATVTRVARKSYVVLPVRILVTDPSLGKISKEPIPRGSLEEKKQYLTRLSEEMRVMKRIRSLHRKAESNFKKFREEIPELDFGSDDLQKRADRMEKGVQKWSTEVANCSASFSGRKIESRALHSEETVLSYVNYVTRIVSNRETDILAVLNSSLEELGVRIESLTEKDIAGAFDDVKRRKGELPSLGKAKAVIDECKTEWQKQDEIYSDYSHIPGLVDRTLSIVETIAAKCFDEAELKAGIAGVYTEITKALAERNLIRATVNMSPGELRGTVKYKDREITHPAGSEKAFFSLAILTALAHYFQTPVLIDEVANNLDTRNLKAFFELVREFKERWGVQYVLSVKETNDFDVDGWVREMRDDVSLYEIREKTIQEVDLTEVQRQG